MQISQPDLRIVPSIDGPIYNGERVERVPTLWLQTTPQESARCARWCHWIVRFLWCPFWCWEVRIRTPNLCLAHGCLCHPSCLLWFHVPGELLKQLGAFRASYRNPKNRLATRSNVWIWHACFSSRLLLKWRLKTASEWPCPQRKSGSVAIPFLAVWNLASCARHKALRITEVTGTSTRTSYTTYAPRRVEGVGQLAKQTQNLKRTVTLKTLGPSGNLFSAHNTNVFVGSLAMLLFFVVAVSLLVKSKNCGHRNSFTQSSLWTPLSSNQSKTTKGSHNLKKNLVWVSCWKTQTQKRLIGSHLLMLLYSLHRFPCISSETNEKQILSSSSRL